MNITIAAAASILISVITLLTTVLLSNRSVKHDELQELADKVKALELKLLESEARCESLLKENIILMRQLTARP